MEEIDLDDLEPDPEEEDKNEGKINNKNQETEKPETENQETEKQQKEKPETENQETEKPQKEKPQKEKPQKETRPRKTSQSSFERLLDSKDPTIKELRIELALADIIDLKSLEKFSKLENLVFKEGKITQLKNIPEGIKRIWCNNNKLEYIELPISIVKVELSNNKLKEKSFTKNIFLEDLDITDNHFKTLEKLPTSLKSLQCSSNDFLFIDMSHLDNLKTFICNNNRSTIMYLIAYPNTIETSILPEHYEFKDKMNAKHEKYKSQVQHFYSLKHDYDTKILKVQKNNMKKLPKCPGCKQTDGLLFVINQKEYNASCKAKCKWMLNIPRENFEPLYDVMDYFEKDAKEYEQKMIDLKMKTLFQHLSTTEGTKISAELKEAIDTNNIFRKQYEKQHIEMFFSEEKRIYELNYNNQIQKKLQELETSLEVSEMVTIQNEVRRIADTIFINKYPNRQVLYNLVTDTYYTILNEFPLERMELNI